MERVDQLAALDPEGDVHAGLRTAVAPRDPGASRSDVFDKHRTFGFVCPLLKAGVALP